MNGIVLNFGDDQKEVLDKLHRLRYNPKLIKLVEEIAKEKENENVEE